MRDVYDANATLLEARTRYFEANAFGPDGGYAETWVDVKVGPIPMRIPNTKSRVRAIRFHDLHHVLTEYRTNFRGECEIGSWEIGSGCADHWAAWYLNLYAFATGLLCAPGDVWRAFVRGRHTKNLYRNTFDDALLSRRVGDVRTELALDRSSPGGGIGDVITFAMLSLLSVWLLLWAAIFGPFVIGLVWLLVPRARTARPS